MTKALPAFKAALVRGVTVLSDALGIHRHHNSDWEYRGKYYGYQLFSQDGRWCAAEATHVKERNLYRPPSLTDHPPDLLFAEGREKLEQRIRRAEEERFAQNCGHASPEELAAGPTFFIMAPSRSGTTWLARLLASHQDVLLPAEKEMDFFSFMHQIYDIGTYCRKFTHLPRKARGEASPTYTGLPRAAIKHIRDCFPGLKLLWLFRDPVQRAWSYIRMQHGAKSGDDLQAVRTYLMCDRDILFFGDYTTCIKQWLDYMPRESFHVELLETADTDLRGLLTRACRFLDVDPGPLLAKEGAEEHVNQGSPLSLSPPALHLLQQAYRRNLRNAQVMLRERFGLDVTKDWDMSFLDQPAMPLLMEQNRNGFLTFLYDSDYYAVEIAPPRRRPLQSLEQIPPALLAEIAAGSATGTVDRRTFFRQTCYSWLAFELDGYRSGRRWPLVPTASELRRDYEVALFLEKVPWLGNYLHTIVENCRRHYVAFWRGQIVGIPHDLLIAQKERPLDDLIVDGLANGTILCDTSASRLLHQIEALP